jgi:hypothetical protein
MKSKYEPLEIYLAGLSPSMTEISLSFREIEDIIGASLPNSAHVYREWWANQADLSTRPQAKAWIDAGFEVEAVQQHQDGGSVIFRRRGLAGNTPRLGWSPETLLENFKQVAELAGVSLTDGDIRIEALPAPHRPPASLPKDCVAVYVFSLGSEFLKIGKAGSNSQARYTSQHYNPRSAPSTLANSLLSDMQAPSHGQADENAIGDWIKTHTDRVNFILNGNLGMPVLTLLEAFLQCRLHPRYEGFKSQNV